ncbi:MAG: mannitol dehydrogenase [Oscillospiraceae bacterium]|nr:mannitol dehydrogenase [Oscillospiraceae bacterium]
MKKQSVIYGAGNIGRGFIGQLFYESGYETSFIDVNTELINLINDKKEYPVKFVSESGINDTSPTEIMIKNIRGIDGSPENSDEISDVISKADIMATAVGVNILKYIMEPVADGINKKFRDNNFEPLNIILCENLVGADKIMRGGVFEYIDDNYKDLYNEKIGFVQASVSRTVPVQTDEMKSDNLLRIVTENYKYLYVDKAGFKGEEIPEIKNIIAYSPFEYIIKRKLYVHNMGHAVCAYLGDISGYEYIWQAINDFYIKTIAQKAMQYSGMALEKIYGEFDFDCIGDLIRRFGNKMLGDTVHRVGIDLKRKLSPNDRIFGAYKLCMENNLPVNYICLAIAAAVNFKSDKLSGKSLSEILIESGSFDLIAENPEDFALTEKFYKAIKSGLNVKDLYYML